MVFGMQNSVFLFTTEPHEIDVEMYRLYFKHGSWVDSTSKSEY